MPVATVKLPDGMEVKLGRIISTVERRALRLSSFVDLGNLEFPAEVDWSEKAKTSLHRMYGNDREGCCVISSVAHEVGTRSGNDRTEVQFPDTDIHKHYVRWCGPGDNGCDPEAVADAMVSEGINGHRYAGWVRVDQPRQQLVSWAIDQLGGVRVCMNLPEEWYRTAQEGFIWRNTAGRRIGGHEVFAYGYNPQGVKVATWGRLGLIEWNGFNNTRIVDLILASIGHDWLNDDSRSPRGVDLAQLRTALDQLGGGTVPPTPPPTPPTPPPIAPRATLEVKDPLPAGTYNIFGSAGQPADQGDAGAPPMVPRSAIWDNIDWGSFGLCIATCVLSSMPKPRVPKGKALPRPEGWDRIDWEAIARGIAHRIDAQLFVPPEEQPTAKAPEETEDPPPEVSDR